MIKVFVIEDEMMYAKRIKYFLSLNPEFEVYVFNELAESLQYMDDSVDCIVLDHHLPDGEGLFHVKKFLTYNVNLPIIVVSGQKDSVIAEDFIEKGAFDYIVKDEFLELKLRMAFKKARRQITFNKEYKRLQESKVRYGNHSLVGSSIEMERIKILVSKAQDTNIFVSIQGETGTGKEVVARTIHSGSKWVNKPFVAINMSAIPLELAESALFGHEVGAFTGAVKTKKGVFEEAADGILFLDEIGEAPLEIQVKLLRAVQERVFRRVGGTKDIPFNARIITATHRSFDELLATDRFREDLFYRLMGFPIKLYPLRQHKSDIEPLSNKFLAEFSSTEGVSVKVLAPEALEKLMGYNWPGNIRELKAVIQLANILSENRLIGPESIRLAAKEELEVHSKAIDLGSKTLKQYNKEIIEEHLSMFENNLEKVSEVLQIGKSTLYRMIKNSEIKRSES